MDSINNIYHIGVNEPYKRYRKTIPSVVAGRRLSVDGRAEVAFLLCSAPDGDTNDYSTAVLEIYSEAEDAYLRQRNKGLFNQGLLAEYSESAPALVIDGSLTDQQIFDIASTTNIIALGKKLKELTNFANATRVLSTAKEIGRPEKSIALIQSRVDELR